MKLRAELLVGVAILASAVASVPTYAQDSQTMETVVVSGMRASLETAMNLKKNSTAIVDSIVAEDIGKFPDLNVTDALQHITGVQVTRDLGEGGSAIAIRGLQQIQTTLNGQEVMTAGGGRTLNLQDLPAELVSGLDVYKTPTSNMLEGGLGGLVDVRTARPFDYSGMKLSTDVRFAYADLAGAVTPQASALFSDRFETSIGEVGFLLNASFQKRAFHQANDTANTPSYNTYGIPGSTLNATTGFYNPIIDGHRDRFGLNGSVQWRPTSNLDFYADANFLKFSTYQNQYVYYFTLPGSSSTGSTANPVVNQFSWAVPGSFSVFPGTLDPMKGAYTTTSPAAFPFLFQTQGVSRDTTDMTQNYVVGGNYNSGKLTASGNVQYVRGRSNLFYTSLGTGAQFTSMTFDNSTSIPSFSFSGGKFADLSSYYFGKAAAAPDPVYSKVNPTWGSLAYNENEYYATQLASKLDAQYEANWGPIKEIDAGVRYVVRDNSFLPIRYSATPTGVISATNIPDLMTQYSRTGFNGTISGYVLPTTFWAADPKALRANLTNVRNVMGLTSVPAVDPKSVYSQSERVTSGYLQAKLETELLVPITGTVGGRIMNVNTAILGYRSNLVNGVVNGVTALNAHTTRTNFLPAANFTAHLSDDVKLRAAFSKTLNLPSFSSMAPGLTLVPGNNTGSGGNPDLKPMQATSYDVSLEYYFGRADSVYIALFDKEIKNYWATRATNMNIDGVDWAITTTGNADQGQARGLEIGYTQWYDFLPGLLSGLGLQANYTYVDSSAPSSVVGLSTPLAQLSRHSANLIGMYEKGPINVRVAYNWRSSYYNSLYYATGQFAGLAANYTKSYGWLDASLGYDVNENMTVSLEGSNLLHTRIDGYATTTTRPGSTTVNDRQFIVALRYKM